MRLKKGLLFSILLSMSAYSSVSMNGLQVTFGAINDVEIENEGYLIGSNEPLGFSCLTENEIILNISSYKYKYEDNELFCYEKGSEHIVSYSLIGWKKNDNTFQSGIPYTVSATEVDIISNDEFEGKRIVFSEEEIIDLKNGNPVTKDVGRGYFIIFNNKESLDSVKKEASRYVDEHRNAIRLNKDKNSIKMYGQFKKSSISVDNSLERRILKSYKKNRNKGVSAELVAKVDHSYNKKLMHSPNELSYMNFIISRLKEIAVDIKSNGIPSDKERFLNEMAYYIYSWVPAFEILTTKNVVDNSLFGNTKEFYANIDKEIYEDYNNFVSTLILENTGIIKDLHRSDIVKKGVRNEVAQGDNHSLIFDLPLTDIYNFNPSNPLSDEWYTMIRYYSDLEGKYYKSRKIISKIISMLENYNDTEVLRSKLRKTLYGSDRLFRHVSEVARYNVFDIPITLYSKIYEKEFKKSEDDNTKMASIAVAYNKACSNLQNYVVSEKTVDKILKVQAVMKKELDEDGQWKQIKARAKLTKEWVNALDRIKIKIE